MEDCLFRVPREPLEAESTVFRDIFLLPQAGDVPVEGQNDENPVVLEGIENDDFAQLLKVVLYRLVFILSVHPLCKGLTTKWFRKYGTNQDLPTNNDQWMAVLKLATLWEFDEIRGVAIETLALSDLNAVDKVVAAMEYGIEEWLLPAYLSLVQRPEPISPHEGHRMGLETALKLASEREKLRLEMVEKGESCSYCSRHICPTTHLVVDGGTPEARSLDFTSIIRAILGL